MLNEKLRLLRNLKGLTQGNLAKELNLSKSSISAYENGYRQPSAEIIKIYCKYFNLTSDSLLGLEDITSPLNASETVNEIINNIISDKDLAEFVLISIKSYKAHKYKTEIK